VLQCTLQHVQIPALVLDCDTDVDVERDMAYREHVATQVKQYTEYVKSLTKSRANAKFEVRHDKCDQCSAC
jgi:hypothetical protein